MKSLNFMTFQVFCDMYKHLRVFYQIYYVLAFQKYTVHAVNIFPVEEVARSFGRKMTICVWSLDKLTVTVRFVP